MLVIQPERTVLKVLFQGQKVKRDQEISMMMIEVRGLQMDAVVVKMEDCFVIIDKLA